MFTKKIKNKMEFKGTKQISYETVRHYVARYASRDLGLYSKNDIDSAALEVWGIATYILNHDEEMQTIDREVRSLEWAYMSLVRSYDSYRWCANHEELIRRARRYGLKV